MSAHTIEELRKHMETVDRYCPAQAKQISAAIDELEAFRAAKSEHRRTRREIRRLAKFVQWEPASMVEERERLKQALKYEGDVAAQAIDDLKKARAEVDRLKNNLVVRENQLRHLGGIEGDNATLHARLREVCDENARLANKSNALEGVNDEASKLLEAERKKNDELRARLDEAQSAAVALAEQCDELRKQNKTLQTQVDAMAKELALRSAELHDMARRGLWPVPAAKVNTNADVCAVEALEEMKARLEGMRETRDQATAKCTDLREQLRIEIGNKEQWRLAAEQLQKERADLNARVEEIEEENARLIRIFDAVRALMVKR